MENEKGMLVVDLVYEELAVIVGGGEGKDRERKWWNIQWCGFDDVRKNVSNSTLLPLTKLSPVDQKKNPAELKPAEIFQKYRLKLFIALAMHIHEINNGIIELALEPERFKKKVLDYILSSNF